MLSDLIRNQLEADPERPLIQFKGEWINRGQLRKLADKLDAALRDQGIADDAPIGFAPHSHPEWCGALMALLAANRPIVMLYSYQSSEALAAKLTDLRVPVAILAAGQWSDKVLAAAREAGTAAIALSRDDVEVLAPWSPEAGPSQRKAGPELGMDLLTSGTTGAPKHFHISYQRMHDRMVVGTAFGADANGMPLLAFFPPSNISGIYTMMPVLVAGHRMVMLEKFDIAAWTEFVRTYRPTTMGLPVAAVQMILDADLDEDTMSSLDYVSTGASTLDPALRRAFEARYRMPVVQAYGATEFGGVITNMSFEDRTSYGDAKADSVGRALPGVELRVRDPNSGELLPAGAEGVLEVKLPVDDSDWIVTTDLVVIDEDGFLFHRGRLDGAIMRGGFKVLPEQITQALMELPGVRAVAVVGLPDSRLGAVPAALVEPIEGADLTQEMLDAHLRAKLPAPSIPRYYKFTDKLPRTISLKPDLKAAAACFDEEAGAR
jgi:acyl-CoA synthetase (AMP-forming)/AMP-acid ligase II